MNLRETDIEIAGGALVRNTAKLQLALNTLATAAIAAGARVYTTYSALTADLVPANGVLAFVTQDATATRNGIYIKNGATTTGSWTFSGVNVYPTVTLAMLGADVLTQLNLITTIQSQLVVDEANLSYLTSSFAKAKEELGLKFNWRFRVANRLYATWDTIQGFRFYKIILAASTKIADLPTTNLADRLLAGAVGTWFRVLNPEILSSGFRFRIGNRLLFTVDTLRGLYPRRMTLPASAKIDDDLATPIVSRLLAGGVAGNLKPLGIENGGVIRMRLGNRLIGQWSKAAGMYFARQTLPSDVKLADQPTLNLIDRLAAGDGISSNGTYVAIAAPIAGKYQISSRRLADGKRFNLTTTPGNNLKPQVTGDNKVLYYSDSAGKMLWQPAEGGSVWPVDPDSIIDGWGDSLTGGTGAVGTGVGQGSYVKQLADMLAGYITSYNNYGVGGQNSAEIEARHGGQFALISVTGNSIPGSGGVAVTSYSVDLLQASGISGALTLHGTLAGVVGVLSGSNSGARGTSTYTFTRDAVGAVTSCPASTPFIPDISGPTRSRINLRVYGENDAAVWANIQPYLAAADSWQKAYAPRNLTGSVLTGVGISGGLRATIDATNASMATAYGNSYVDLNSVPTTAEMTQIGFVPDSYGVYSNGSTDAADLAANLIPSGMRNGATTGNGDFGHLNNFGYALWALRVYRKIYALNWFPGIPNI